MILMTCRCSTVTAVFYTPKWAARHCRECIIKVVQKYGRNSRRWKKIKKHLRRAV